MLQRGTTACRGHVLRSLILGLVGLEAQFKRHRQGQHETALSLLGLIDDARAVRKLPPLSGETLFFPGLDKPVPPRNARDVGAQHREPEDLARELHPAYRQGLAALAQDPLGTEGAAILYGVAARLQGACDSAEGKRLWWLVAGLCEALREARLSATPSVRSLLTRIEPEIARLAILGEARFNARLPKTLLRNLLFRIALMPGTEGQAGMIKRAYQLEDLLPGTAHAGGGESLELSVSESLRHRVFETTVKIRHQLEALGRSRRYRPELYEPMTMPLAQIADLAAMLGEMAASEQLESLTIRMEAIASGREDAHDRGIWAMVAVLFRVEKRMVALKGRCSEGNAESSLFPELPDFRLDALTGALGMVDSVRELLKGRVKKSPERFALEAVWALRRAAQFCNKAEDDLSSQWLGSLASWLTVQPRDTLLARKELREFATVLACAWCRLDAGASGRKYPRDPVPVATQALKAMGVNGTAQPAVSASELPEPALVQPLIPLHLPDADSEGDEVAEEEHAEPVAPPSGPSDTFSRMPFVEELPMAKEMSIGNPDVSGNAKPTVVTPLSAAAPMPSALSELPKPSVADEPAAELPLDPAAPDCDLPAKHGAVEGPRTESLEGALDLLESLVEDFETRTHPEPVRQQRRPPQAKA